MRSGSVRPAIKAATRLIGQATADLRPLPDFLLIGTKRGGTTSFYFDLLEHPGVLRLYPPPVPGLKADATKGVHYFDSNAERSERWYRSYMPTRVTRSVVARRTGLRPVAGEASPYYLFHPAAAERAKAVVPEARLLVLLRDPALRAHSHWKERRRSGAEPLDFLDALDAEPDRLAGERERLLADPVATSYAWEQQSYLTQSRYAASLRPWIDAFGRDRVLVLASEDYYTDPLRVLREADGFLGLPPRQQASSSIRNAAPGAQLAPEVLTRLEESLAEDVAALESLTGRRFPWG